MSSSAHSKLVLDLVLEVLQLAPKLQLKGDRMTKDLGLTSSRWWCLVHVAEANGELTVADVARRMNLQRQTVQRFADALVDSGMIAYSVNPDHKRARLLSITEDGEAALTTIEQRELIWAKNVAASLGTHEIESAVKALAAIRGDLTVLSNQ
ncbi:MarR family winged helix-turn-helix transcriptional regulator [Oceanicoccus sp. KOV_DT_Chl]|uniref:MarR family winged helix-turn-helix transcriptional regulator n=1 Tax=Oceanicoccus sp. KOV_DT_Chl TaxID=1904639 RepID=UPI00135C0C32|nr:MarR family transcriptional regulator [Oceanicoccus sp. KOV_DT_Chl]